MPTNSKEKPFKYGEISLDDGDTLQLMNLKIRVLYTPGHTNDSLCYVVHESRNSNTHLMVFTGDTLFAADVGRTDLLGAVFNVNNQQSILTVFTRSVDT